MPCILKRVIHPQVLDLIKLEDCLVRQSPRPLNSRQELGGAEASTPGGKNSRHWSVRFVKPDRSWKAGQPGSLLSKSLFFHERARSFTFSVGEWERLIKNDKNPLDLQRDGNKNRGEFFRHWCVTLATAKVNLNKRPRGRRRPQGRVSFIRSFMVAIQTASSDNCSRTKVNTRGEKTKTRPIRSDLLSSCTKTKRSIGKSKIMYALYCIWYAVKFEFCPPLSLAAQFRYTNYNKT